MRIGHLASVGAAAAGLALVAAPAHAAAPYNVTVGSSTSGSFALTASATGSSVLTAGSQTLTCTSSSVSSASVTAGTYGSSPANVADITGIGWSGCTWLGGIGATVTVPTPFDWDVNLTGGNTSGSSDTVTGTITAPSATPIKAHVALASGCEFDVIGTSAGNIQLTEANQQLQVLGTGGNLQIQNRNSAFLCLGLVSNGQVASFAGTYAVSTGGAGNLLVS